MGYFIKLNLNGSTKSNYYLAVRVKDYVYSKQNPETNYIYKNNSILNFDQTNNVFYSIKEGVYNQVAATKEPKSVKRKVNGNFPVIILGKETYYYINNRWYQQGTNELKEIWFGGSKLSHL